MTRRVRLNAAMRRVVSLEPDVVAVVGQSSDAAEITS